jgi:hypothetical protein
MRTTTRGRTSRRSSENPTNSRRARLNTARASASRLSANGTTTTSTRSHAAAGAANRGMGYRHAAAKATEAATAASRRVERAQPTHGYEPTREDRDDGVREELAARE